MPNKNKKSKKKGGLFLAIWALGFLIILILFLVKLDDIKANLKQTNAFERLFHTTPTFIQNYEDKKPDAQEPPLAEEGALGLQTEPLSSPAAESTPVVPLPPAPDMLADTIMEQSQPESAEEAVQEPEYVPEAPIAEKPAEPEANIEKSLPIATEPAAQVQVQKPAVVEPAVPATTTAKLCFVSIGGDGIVSRKEIARVVPKSNSPLTENIKQLLKGPSALESSKSCQTLIPQETRLLSAAVRNGIAFLSFSEEFEFNQAFGVEGYLGQLMQIVYTATEFSTVNSVQFLIEGQKKEYLGSEGVWIGSPLSRASFK